MNVGGVRAMAKGRKNKKTCTVMGRLLPKFDSSCGRWMGCFGTAGIGGLGATKSI